MQEIELIQGDCLDKMKNIPTGSIDLVLTDPPYGTTMCKWDTIIPFEPMWEQLKRITKPNAAILLFAQTVFQAKLILSNTEMYRYDYVWEKEKAGNFLYANKMPLKIHENICVFYQHLPTYNPQKRKNPGGVSTRHFSKTVLTKHFKELCGSQEPLGKGVTEMKPSPLYEPDMLLPNSILYFPREQFNVLHPTQKPARLLEFLIKTYTNVGETVLDFTMGSGSTGAVCRYLTNRNFIGIEDNPKYYEIAKKRIMEKKGLLY